MFSLLTLALASTASAACTRSFLQDIAATYIKAQTAGTPSLLPLNTPLTYVENDLHPALNASVLTTPLSIDFHRSVYDTTTCSTYTELNANSSSHPYVIVTLIRVDAATSKITTIDSVVSDDGDWIFDAKAHLSYALTEKWDPIPAEKRDTREVLLAAANAYLNQWGNVSLPVPLGTPCARLEGGLYTGSRNASSNSCFMPAFPMPLTVGNRRWVIDEEMGTVGMLNDFPFLEASKPNGTTPSSNMFYIVGGLIRYIHENTVCATRMCGR
ncbi:hypothetical protein B0T16DRAFT_518759 [Cercophora newfieldiana]|uniref:DUF8021 domain-containing protein n=1 Tax=Cercophora newfieldiana TaxID=92897 RepID=A0AA40CJC6_9PEZI|nr:hypothetical protein B0T16DRAFT_518759 [Cercophora newfieldiana]